ncbi:hypothetical protein C7212DRAFT_327041, partial [Tuber magnatum]
MTLHFSPPVHQKRPPAHPPTQRQHIAFLLLPFPADPLASSTVTHYRPVPSRVR